MNLADKLAAIRVVILDIDGVLTDGRIGYGHDLAEIKFFDVKDGLGIKLLQRVGVRVGVLSGRKSLANQRRIQELGLDFAIEGAHDKIEAFQNLLPELAVKPDSCLYVGDDLVDIPVMTKCGVAVAVGDASPDAKAAADVVTEHAGGRGAVREVAEMLLKAAGRWDDIVSDYWQK